MPSRYWKSLNERDRPHDREDHATRLDAEPDGASRRDFLRLAGFSVAGVVASSCSRAPIRHAIPYVAQPDGVVPGRARWYATTCGGCAAGCGLRVKERDGRPIKVEGCPDHPLSAGGVCAVGQAALLSVYDRARFRAPQLRGVASTWAVVDADMRSRLDTIRRGGGGVRVLTSTVHSPSARGAIGRFLDTLPDAAHVEYDEISASAILDAHLVTHGVRALPRHLFERADVIVGVDADFLGPWISPVEFTAGYARRRRQASGPLAWHAQVESRVSLTGGKADLRISMAPDEADALVFDVADIIENGRAGSGAAGMLAERLLAARGRSLVVAGSGDLAMQIRCNRINQALGNYGSTLDLGRPSQQRRGDDRAVARLLQDVRDQRIAALLVSRANPVFDLPGGDVLTTVPLLVSFAERPDETSAAAHVVCPDHSAFEAWGDSEAVAGVASLTQPTVRPLGHTRAFIESLSMWAGAPAPAYELVRRTWRETIFPRQTAVPDFDRFWDATLEAGHAAVSAATTAGAFVPATPNSNRPPAVPDAVHLVLYHKPAMPAGEHSYNPLLHELPDPVTKIVWDNYASIGPGLAAARQITTGDVVRIDTGGQSLELPALVQPGQHDRVVAVALGYGGAMTERFKTIGHHWFQSRPTVGENGRIGANAVRFVRVDDGRRGTTASGVTLTRTGRTHALACTQDHHTLTVPARLAPAGGERWPIVQDIAASDLASSEPGPVESPANLWPEDHPATGHRWGMVIDLHACTGCSACVVGCQIENNVPIAGKDEVRRNREMHWLRLDRYFSEDADGQHMASQPMLCQHCAHAPCETVCPTLATLHSEEGLNQQVYNRCVGTRYCMNNCPYKTRRFNWFEYSRDPGTEHLILNPDVAVRSRGVMEKCTFCVQRIQDAKIEARRLGVPVKDGDVQTACQQSCPAQAITFGDMNDPTSRVAVAARDRRGYTVLEALNVRPSVTYLKVVRQSSVAVAESEHDG
ncbi:MAG: Fe-S cluster-containing hydrogenase [Acidobacteria bacterium]|nr:Fe-S cluster-containing hydrogenase [Acidobacteriota bacterium]